MDSTTNTGKKGGDIPKQAFLFELDTASAKGRSVVFDAVKKSLTGKGVKLTPAMFSRYCLGQPLHRSLVPLIRTVESSRSAAERVAAAAAAAAREAMTASALTLDSSLEGLLKEATKRGAALGALSGLSDADAKRLSASLGLDTLGVAVRSHVDDEKGWPSADGWLTLARDLSVPPPLCIVVATGSTACKAALCAAMRCVVAPDQFTAFQDFSGADSVVDSLDSLDVGAVLEAAEVYR